MNIIGITNDRSGNHDNSACLVKDGKVVFAVAEERLSRKKHDVSFPSLAIQACLDSAGIKLEELDYIAIGTCPLSTLRLILVYFKGLRFLGKFDYIRWLLREKILARHNIKILDRIRCLRKNATSSLEQLGMKKEKVIYVAHPLAHAVSTYRNSGFDNCLTVDLEGYGIDEKGAPTSGRVYLCQRGKLQQVEDIPVYASLALTYGAVTLGLGFKFNDGEGKTMGLAAFGDPQICYDRLAKLFPNFKNDKWVPTPFWLDIMSVSRREVFITTNFYKRIRQLVEDYGRENVAAAAQLILEEAVIRYFNHLKKVYGVSKFALAGGLFLNVKLNMRLLNEVMTDELFIYPNPGDGGVAVGAALQANYILGGQSVMENMESTYFGPSFSEEEIKQCLDSHQDRIVYRELSDKDLVREAAVLLTEGKVLGWLQGRAEWGPRALGNRSVIADPRIPDIKDRINNLLKKRDWFMPFAPSILYEKAHKYVKHLRESPFMILADEVVPEVADKIPAVVHIDGTMRPHLVKKEINPLYYALIEEFEKLSGLAIVLNTSFNRHGLPMVNSPQDAVEHLIWGCVDELVIGDFLVTLK